MKHTLLHSRFRITFIALSLLVTGNYTLNGHDLFIRPEAYQVPPKKTKRMVVLNGSFSESISPVSSSVVKEISLMEAKGVDSISKRKWSETKLKSRFWRTFLKSNSINLNHTNSFETKFSAEGTWPLGVSLHPSRIAMEPAEFIEYVKTEAYCEINLEDYGLTGEDDLVKERYAKNAKTIIQAGDNTSDHAMKPLGQAAEIVPLTNPLEANVGDVLRFKIFVDGKVLAGQNVVTGRLQDSDEKTDNDRVVLTSDTEGIIQLPIIEPTVYWLKFIHLRAAPQDDAMDFNSYWGSLTFEID